MPNDILELLIQKNKDDQDILRLIKDTFDNFNKYVSICISQQFFIKTEKQFLGEQEYKEKYQEIDKKRTLIHNTCIDGIAIINRLCERNSIPVLYSESVSKERDDRVKIADFIGDFVNEVYKSRLR